MKKLLFLVIALGLAACDALNADSIAVPQARQTMPRNPGVQQVDRERAAKYCGVSSTGVSNVGPITVWYKNKTNRYMCVVDCFEEKNGLQRSVSWECGT